MQLLYELQFNLDHFFVQKWIQFTEQGRFFSTVVLCILNLTCYFSKMCACDCTLWNISSYLGFTKYCDISQATYYCESLHRTFVKHKWNVTLISGEKNTHTFTCIQNKGQNLGILSVESETIYCDVCRTLLAWWLGILELCSTLTDMWATGLLSLHVWHFYGDQNMFHNIGSCSEASHCNW